jgi:lipoteichoic acid synthase
MSLAHRSTRRNGIIGVAGLTLFFKQFLVLVLADAPLVPDVEPALLATVLLELAPALVLRGRRLVAWAVLIELVVTTVVLADLVYFRLSSSLISLQQLVLILHMWQLGPTISSGLRATDLLLLLDVPLLIWAARRWRESQPFRPRAAVVAVLCAVAAFGVVVWQDPHWHRSAWRNAGGAGHVGLVGFHLLNGGNGLLLAARAQLGAGGSPGAVQTWFEQRKATPLRQRQERPPPFQNVIVIQFESLQQTVVGMRIGGRSVTPTLDRLSALGLTYDHAYSQVAAGNTSDAEWLSLCSLYPSAQGVAFHIFTGSHLRCLPSVLRKRRLQTLEFHGNATDVYGRRWIYPTLGFDQLQLGTDLGPGENRGLGLSDDAFYTKVLAQLPRDHPFMAELVTLTSHRPFDDVPQVLDLGPLQGTTTGAYLQSIAYADAALGRFVDGLRVAGLLDRTLLVIFGDHVGVNHRDTGAQLLPGVDLDGPLAQFTFDRQVPLLFIGKGLGPRTVHTPVGQLDIAPTIAGLLGIDAQRSHFLGRDLLATEERAVHFLGGTAVESTRVLLVGRSASPLCLRPNGRPLPGEACADLEAVSSREREMSQRVLDLDLVRLLRP